MATEYICNGIDHSWSIGQAHPEIAEIGEKALRRDLRMMRKHRVKSFVRNVYDDIRERDQFQAMAAMQGKNLQDETIAVQVINIGPDTNARIPLTSNELSESLELGRLDLRDLRQKQRKGFRS